MSDTDHAQPKRWERAFYAFVRGLIFVVAKLFGRISVVGEEHIPADRPFVLAPVHRSNIDFALVSLVTRRRMRYMGKDSIWRYKFPGKLVSALGAFPVRRGSADREALRTVISVVENGEPVVVFPEGTRRGGPVVEEMFDGPAYVAARTGVPIIPVGIGGSERAMPRGSKFIHPGKLVLIVGQPLDPPAATEGGRVSRKAVKDLTERLRVEVQKLFDDAQVRAGAPTEPEGGPATPA